MQALASLRDSVTLLDMGTLTKRKPATKTAKKAGRSAYRLVVNASGIVVTKGPAGQRVTGAQIKALAES